MSKLVLNKEVFLKKVVKNKTVLNGEGNINKTKLAQEMGIDRSLLFRVLEGQLPPGRKFIEGSLKVCEDCGLDELFSSTEVVKIIPKPKSIAG